MSYDVSNPISKIAIRSWNQTFTVLSQEPVAAKLPVLLEETLQILDECPSRTETHSPLATFQILAVLSLEPLNTYSPSTPIHSTHLTFPVCPLKVFWHSFGMTKL
jgi:hypothetical protein